MDYDIILSEVNPIWQWIRVLYILGTVVMVLGCLLHLIRRWHARRLAGNVLLASLMGLALLGASTSVVRFNDPVSIRLPLSFFLVTAGLVCVWEPRRRRETGREPWDLL